MTKVFLAAGVAALAISAPATAQHAHGGKGGQAQQQRPERQAQRAPQQARQQPDRVARASARMERARPAQQQQVAHQQARPAQQRQVARQQARPAQQRQVARQQARPAQQRQAARQQAHPAQQQAKQQQARPARVQQAQRQGQDRQQMQARRAGQVQTRQVDRQQLRNGRQAQLSQSARLDRQQLRTDRQLQANNLPRERVQIRPDNVARIKALAADRTRVVPVNRYGTRVLPITTARSLVGVPFSTAGSLLTLNALPRNVQYLYPDTPDYYYRYGDGYLYQVDRGSNLIAALLPLLAGGYMPGSYLPNRYMSSYAPDYYGLNSFYPASYGANYGYGYQNLCNRYANGVVYRVDCVSGMIESVVPLYASGYGVGQMLPSAYSTYNVPYQYRDLYYNNADYGYRYAPGAIYQYDQRSSLITSVAALLSPGFTVGQSLPMGYNTYNVPYAYRSTYYDTPNAWYRYNNGNIYQVDPATQLVSAVVASILT